MRRSLLVLAAVPLALFAAPVPKETDAQKLAKLYGTPVDPLKDCKFTLDGAKLTVTAGKGDHDLAVEAKELNAPRVLKEIEGDFTVSVKVSGEFPKGAKGANEKRTIVFYGAGILVWEDEKSYIRLERAYVDQLDGTPTYTYGSWELRAAGEWVRRGTQDDFPMTGSDPAWFKLTRKGNTFTAAISKDGKGWKVLDPIDAELGKKVKVGVCAVHICDTPFDTAFEDYELKATEVKKDK